MFEQMGGIYAQRGDYFLPDLQLRPIGIWGQSRLHYFWEHYPILYTNLKTNIQINFHLVDVEEQANELFLRLVKCYAASEGVVEGLKAQDPMERVRMMNGIRAKVMVALNNEMVFT